MATRQQVRKAVGDALDSIDGVRGHAYTPGQVNPPAVVVIEVDVSFDATMQRGADDFTVLCRAMTGGDLRAAQDKLDEIVSTVKAELDGDLDGTVHFARVSRIRGDTEGQIEVGGSTFAVIDFEIEVVA